MADPRPLRDGDIAAAFGWWQDAGVDFDFLDDATDWLAEPVAPEPIETPVERQSEETPIASPPNPKNVDLLGESPPGDLEAFINWWKSDPALGPGGRVPPRGNSNASLMVLVTDPEDGDTDTLLSQSQGRLLSRILSAIGLDQDEVYFASAVPRHQPMAEGAAIAASGYRDVLLHHIALAKPQKIIAFGANILPLLGHNAAQETKSLHEINHDGVRTPLMTSDGLDSMLSMPRLKARFWRKWLEWVEDGK